MGLDRNGYYTLKDILQYKCRWNIIYGDRARGKSYAVKKRALDYAWKTQKPTIGYIRRLRDDITAELVSKYFQDRGTNLVEEVTKGEYDTIDVYRGYLWWAKRTDGKLKRGEPCGEAFALNLWRRYKSTGHPYLTHFIVEEVLADKGYVSDEPDVLQNLVSTCARLDGDVEVYLIGNLISRVCPYFQQWNLQGVRTQKPGTIDIYKMKQEDGKEVPLAVERCPDPPDDKKSSLFFGRAEKSIQGGQWETKEYAHLPDDYENFNEVYNIVYDAASGFKFNLKLLSHKTEGYLIIYVYPAKVLTGRILSSAFSTDYFTTPQLNRENPVEVLYHNLIVKNKIVFCDNLTGEDFHNSLKAEGRQVL